KRTAIWRPPGSAPNREPQKTHREEGAVRDTDTAYFAGDPTYFRIGATWYHFAEEGRDANGGGWSHRREADVTHSYLAGRSRRGRSSRGAGRGVARPAQRAGGAEPRRETRCTGRDTTAGRPPGGGAGHERARPPHPAARQSAADHDATRCTDADIRCGTHRARRSRRHCRPRPAGRQGRAARWRQGDRPVARRPKRRVGG